MPDKPKLKYEKPVSIDMGRVAPVLGDVCSFGQSASDCPQGSGNSSVPACYNGSSDSNSCNPGSAARGTGCVTGTSATGDTCNSGSIAIYGCSIGNTVIL